MKFGPIPIAEAIGAILAHAEPRAQLKKGRLLSRTDVEALTAAGVDIVTVARLERGDVTEDEAAAKIANALAGLHVRAGEAFTGRANLYARSPGLACVGKEAIDAINTIHESVTVATLPQFDPVRSGSMLATIKIIPYAAPDWAVAKAVSHAARSISVAPFVSKAVTLISTELPGLKRSLIEKNRQVTQDRVTALGSNLTQTIICPHTDAQIAAALAQSVGDLILLFGATANADRDDVIPSGIVKAGGTVHHIGMPVDPGNLLVLGELGERPVVGLPGCARSPKRNGFDFVLERLCANLPVTARDLMGMGVGGLLKEIPVRGQLRDASSVSMQKIAPRIAAIVLAAGRSTRMGGNKLVMHVAGRPVLTHTLQAIEASGVKDCIVVTGHDREAIEAILPDGVRRVHNPAFASGMASSLKAGFAALGPEVDAAFVFLGDMPALRPADIGEIKNAYDPSAGNGILVPVYHGKRGHPVLFDRAFWPAILAAKGDRGARDALIDNTESVCEVAIEHPGVIMDADTPEALSAIRALMEP